MAEIYMNIDQDVKKSFKLKCVMDEISQTDAVAALMKLYADGKINIKTTLNT